MPPARPDIPDTPGFTALIAEAAEALGLSDAHAIPLARAKDRTHERCVVALAGGGRMVAVKIDLRGDDTGRLAREHVQLVRLRPLFAAADGAALIEPILLGGNGRFLVTGLVEAPTMLETLDAGPAPADARALFTAAGRWLRVLHSADTAEIAPFWPRWMIERLQELASGPAQADPARAQAVTNAIAERLRALRGTNATEGLCHRDFHANNLLFDGQTATGLDLTEVTRKLALYDIVDLLRADVQLVLDGPLHPSGIAQTTIEAFVAGYGPLPDPRLFEAAMQARLAMDWLTVTPERFATSAAQRHRFDTLSLRLRSVLPI
ncbi:aminoglycoside phosphotransferase family protein [Anianabacter salinae]|uniref:aminoglycoside phosphotransferase family protein n=1 Tax=Anianabacter salinae TaxID=2851023 RepID=UPI00225DF743|nr:aminoglycoside phosphotransferase family protein [Anianabacter salinae]MBV0912669.1 aminoglycoside phosphotransferase family protein [Anianabacter salinae]